MIEWSAITLTLQLAGVSTLVLLVLGTPLAWWLARADGKLKTTIETLTALPLVLPPTVLGFYLLIFLSPNTPLGEFWFTLTGEHLTFSFSALVIASVVYSLPFMVQPLQGAFESLGRAPLEAAASLGASPLDTFIHVVLPLSKRGYLTAVVLTFAHTIGEFGVVLMVGGNIPERTRVISIAIYEHVETLNYAQAHTLAAGLLLFSFIVLLLVYGGNKRAPIRLG
ncbi:MAG: molybdate ABC transporter permease subunit [Gammaproteobacteria bacterium]|nr:molybdate ABC transporter permease subunit [Gammaproteobacteria bacterium]MCH1549898.1 molybdate ABC transporter permease subunit [Pseudomonadales bacterium]